MGLTNFRKKNDYIKIRNLRFEKGSKSIAVQFGYYIARGGALLSQIDLYLDRQASIVSYKAAAKAELSLPNYPDLCSTCEANVPMWTADSTDEEKAAYATAKAAYASDVEAYNAAVETIEVEAETANEFDTHFTDAAMYSSGNIEKCIYNWAKTLDVFDGVEDVLEEE